MLLLEKTTCYRREKVAKNKTTTKKIPKCTLKMVYSTAAQINSSTVKNTTKKHSCTFVQQVTLVILLLLVFQAVLGAAVIFEMILSVSFCKTIYFLDDYCEGCSSSGIA